MGRPKAKLELSDAELETLKSWTRRRSSAQSLALRAEIVLRCASGADNLDVAEELRLSNQTVGKWRQRFVEQRLDGLLDEPRVGRPRTILDEDVSRIVDMTLHQKPSGATHWSSARLAEKASLSTDAVKRVWRAFGLRPGKADSFSLSKDPQFVEKVRDIVGLYMSPPSNALVLCVDEKSQMQALDRSQPLLPMTEAHPERRSSTYYRHGTTSLFAALNIATGNVIGRTFRRHRAIEFRRFLDEIDAATPAELDVHMVMDNYATHKTPAIKRWLLRHPRFKVHFTPTNSSWLNLVESFFAIVDRRVTRRGVHRSTYALERDVREFLDEHNQRPRPFIWTKTADQILESLKRYCTRATTVARERVRRENEDI